MFDPLVIMLGCVVLVALWDMCVLSQSFHVELISDCPYHEVIKEVRDRSESASRYLLRRMG